MNRKHILNVASLVVQAHTNLRQQDYVCQSMQTWKRGKLLHKQQLYHTDLSEHNHVMLNNLFTYATIQKQAIHKILTVALKAIYNVH